MFCFLIRWCNRDYGEGGGTTEFRCGHKKDLTEDRYLRIILRSLPGTDQRWSVWAGETVNAKTEDQEEDQGSWRVVSEGRLWRMNLSNRPYNS